MDTSFRGFITHQVRGAWEWINSVIDFVARGHFLLNIILILLGLGVLSSWIAGLVLLEAYRLPIALGGISTLVILAAEIGAYRTWRDQVEIATAAVEELDELKARAEDRQPRNLMVWSKSGVLRIKNSTPSTVYSVKWEFAGDGGTMKTTNNPFPVDELAPGDELAVSYKKYMGFSGQDIKISWRDSQDASDSREMDFTIQS